jgi:hypothetical protein
MQYELAEFFVNAECRRDEEPNAGIRCGDFRDHSRDVAGGMLSG